MDVGIPNRGIRSKYTPHTDRVQITQGTQCIRISGEPQNDYIVQ